jgi:hypothetical protein
MAAAATATAVEAATTTMEAASATLEGTAVAAMGYVSTLSVEVGLPMEASLSVPVSVVITAPSVAAAIAIYISTIE